MKNQIWCGFGGFAKYRSAVLLNRFVIYMTNIITPNMDKFVFIKMIMIVVVTSVGVLQHNINNTTAQEQPPATVKWPLEGETLLLRKLYLSPKK
jgi:hypothetical protein